MLGIVIVLQFLYPSDRLLPFAHMDTVSVGGWKKADAVWEVNKKLSEKEVIVQRGNESSAYLHVAASSLGITPITKEILEHDSYPWYVRIVPTSFLWYGLIPLPQTNISHNDVKAKAFIETKLANCNLAPLNASLAYKDASLQLVSAKNGGVCKQADVLTAISELKPTLGEQTVLRFPATITPPVITNAQANKLKSVLESRTSSGVNLVVESDRMTIPQKDILSWLTFLANDSKLDYSVDPVKSDAYFAQSITKKLTKPAGTTQVSTTDFTETARTNGPNGQTINANATRESLKAVLNGKKKEAVATPAVVPAKVVYNRSYTKSSTGIKALMTHYAEEHQGTYGVSFAELDGQGRSAEYNGANVFTTASTYKLFVAYGTLKKIESGEWKWEDGNIASGRNRATCFDDMIVKSDNACAEAILKSLGLTQLTKDIRALGLSQSGFTGSTPQTTANDLRLFLSKLQKNELGLKPESSERLLSAMKRNVYRQGVPAGANGTVADKVGFLNGLLHDAAIVYSLSGTYVLIVMTDGSSWANIAELTRKIETLR